MNLHTQLKREEFIGAPNIVHAFIGTASAEPSNWCVPVYEWMSVSFPSSLEIVYLYAS